jgi:hypothetical protein
LQSDRAQQRRSPSEQQDPAAKFFIVDQGVRLRRGDWLASIANLHSGCLYCQDRSVQILEITVALSAGDSYCDPMPAFFA